MKALIFTCLILLMSTIALGASSNDKPNWPPDDIQKSRAPRPNWPPDDVQKQAAYEHQSCEVHYNKFRETVRCKGLDRESCIGATIAMSPNSICAQQLGIRQRIHTVERRTGRLVN